MDKNKPLSTGEVRIDEIYDRVVEKYNQILFSNMENGIIHNPYNQEIREYAAVENGDLEELDRVVAEDYTARNGTLSYDPVRNAINLGIVVTTLARRSAMAAGVSAEECYTLSDATIQIMEESQDIDVIRHIYRTTERRYTQMVSELKGKGLHLDSDTPAAMEYDSLSAPVSADNDLHKAPTKVSNVNLHISHAKDYIFTHLHSKLTVAQIADAIGLEANYLSALFKKVEHQTLKQYILKEKIALVRNMLSYSPFSYVEIANYLGFSSQSHLGEQFRKVTGMTMREYRERYGKEDFLASMKESEEGINNDMSGH